MSLNLTLNDNLSLIRIDKNIAQIILNEIISKDDYHIVTAVLFYIFHSNQNNLFGFGTIDPREFSSKMDFKEGYLRRKHENPLQIKNLSPEEIEQLYADEKENPENRIWDSILENAFYILTQPITFSEGAKTVGFDNEEKYYSKISTFQFLTEISCCFVKRKDKRKDKIVYHYKLNPLVINNLAHYYFNNYLEDLISIRKISRNLTSFFLFLKDQENFETSKFNRLHTIDFDTCVEKLNLNPETSEKEKKRTINNALKKIANHTHFKFDYKWIPKKQTSRWDYLLELKFPVKFKDTHELVKHNQEEKRRIFEEYLLFELLSIYKHLYSRNVNIDNLQSLFFDWLIDMKANYKEKQHAYDRATLRLYGKLSDIHDDQRFSFFSSLAQPQNSFETIFPNLNPLNFGGISDDSTTLNQLSQRANNNQIEEFTPQKRQNCIDWLVDKGFSKEQAENCANNDSTIRLFFKWKYTHGFDNLLETGRKTKLDAQKLFFYELKKNKLKI